MDEHAFKQGKWAFYNNAECQYYAETVKAKEWQRGYNAAYYENLNKVKGKERGRK